ncbi:hypothetical protein [Deinococcus sp. QL22]|uniref:hypothetical protein n=1 Tax=Deinococcus sp. QL22 TaxID=2939437 RepID=UPI0020176BC6|nr:hypothetical protein [Deinococcus sp. QL22]UQN06524.1 hypothetical protein M1R55_00980 [Deinococcus sp. QL22]
MHHYELGLWPTAAQEIKLERLAQAYQQLRWVAEQECALSELTGTVIADFQFSCAGELGLPQALIKAVSVQTRVAEAFFAAGALTNLPSRR